MLKVAVRAITRTGISSQEEVVAAIRTVLQPAEFEISVFRTYWKMPDRKEMLLMFQIKDQPMAVLAGAVGIQPVLHNDREVIFDTSRGSVLCMADIDWLHLEVME